MRKITQPGQDPAKRSVVAHTTFGPLGFAASSLIASLVLFGCGGASSDGLDAMEGEDRLSEEGDSKQNERDSEEEESSGKGDEEGEAAGADPEDEDADSESEASEGSRDDAEGERDEVDDDEDGASTDGTSGAAAGDPEFVIDPAAASEEPTVEDEGPEVTDAVDADGAEADSADGDAEGAEAASWLEGDQDDRELEVVEDLSVLVIFDNSGSMDTYWGGESRWTVANRALYEAIAPVRTSLMVGAIRFPTDQQCGVADFGTETQFEFALAGDFLDRWAIESTPPYGSTPLGQAFVAADAAIANASERGLLTERFNVIVVTDGEPNCETDLTLLTALPARWLERGVHTHVLGIPGSTTAATLLNDIAEAGGTEHFRQIGTAEQLEEDLVLVTR